MWIFIRPKCDTGADDFVAIHSDVVTDLRFKDKDLWPKDKDV